MFPFVAEGKVACQTDSRRPPWPQRLEDHKTGKWGAEVGAEDAPRTEPPTHRKNAEGQQTGILVCTFDFPVSISGRQVDYCSLESTLIDLMYSAWLPWK